MKVTAFAAALGLALAVQVAPAQAAAPLGLPSGVRFGATLAETEAAVAKACVSAPVRRIDPPFLDNIKTVQMQIDCEGLVFQGQPRHVEFVVGDDRLAMIWLMVKPDEETAVVAALAKAYGPPKTANARYVVFPGHEVAWRRDRSEVLYYAPERVGDVSPNFQPDRP